MIPLRLSLRNFMCYRDEAVLNLDGVHLACLSGENGAGKSAILEAITWSLWGYARGHSMNDELMSHGSTDMEIDFIFSLNEHRYRVIRKRALKGKSRDPILELQIADDSALLDMGDGEEEADGDDNSARPASLDPGKWRSLSGATIRETQAAINNLLKIDYETFVNSAYILQGHADSFTVKSATERKAVLAKILGLEQYDLLEARAKEQARERKARLKELEGWIAQIDRELVKRPAYATDLATVEEELSAAQNRRAALLGEVAELQTRAQSLEHSRTRLREMQEQSAKRDSEINDLKGRIDQATYRRTQMENLLEREHEIEAGYADLTTTTEAEDRFNEAMRTLRALENKHSQFEQVIQREGVALERDEANHERRIRDLTSKLSGREVVLRQLSEALDQVRKLEQVQQQHEDTRCERENFEARYRALSTEIGTLEEEGDTLKRKLELIVKSHAGGSGHVDCPLCGTGLTAEALERVRLSYEHDITEKRRDYKRKRDERDEVKERIVTAERRLGALEQQIKQLAMWKDREAERKETLKTLDNAEKDRAEEESLLGVVKKKRASQDYAHSARAQQAEVASQMVTLSYDEGAHRTNSSRLADLRARQVEKHYHTLQTAREELPRIKHAVESDTFRLTALSAEQRSVADDIAALHPQVAALPEVTRALLDKQREEKELSYTVDGYIGRRGELKNNLARCDLLQEDKARYTLEQDATIEERTIYDQLAEAFGKNGIQAMIMENVIPELEDETNTVLGRMTDGRMSVEFPMQKSTKTTKSVVETFDINISDEMGTRAYEMYSGGEAFRVNFAVRIALSKLLARRAGTQLQTLVIDEGFGSQDGQGREKLVGAIRAIQDDFEKILVITHIEELKEEFPVRIDVVKTPTGSRIVRSEIN